MEKQSLLNENSFTQKEINKLSEKYAQILGHQNNKQKIHHVRKLKEENLKLKAVTLNFGLFFDFSLTHVVFFYIHVVLYVLSSIKPISVIGIDCDEKAGNKKLFIERFLSCYC